MLNLRKDMNVYEKIQAFEEQTKLEFTPFYYKPVFYKCLYKKRFYYSFMKKMKSKINYIKFLFFILTLVIAYLIFYERDLDYIHKFISSIGYFGIFLVGGLYTYGFTSAPATAFLLLLAADNNIFLGALVGGLGSLIADIFLFKTINYSFKEEIKFATKKRKRYLTFLPKYIFTILGAIIIASPLPDELGISLLAFDNNLSFRDFSIISYILNTIGIFFVLLIGKSI